MIELVLVYGGASQLGNFWCIFIEDYLRKLTCWRKTKNRFRNQRKKLNLKHIIENKTENKN
jgi:hypothetical protein